MRLKYIEIGDYKNLNDFKLRLNGASFIDILVGKNGTGKSNFFEALLEIFQHLLEVDYIIEFPYKLGWIKNGVEHFIHWDGAIWKNSDGDETTKPTLEILPENILIYYSGHNTNISGVIKKYENAHQSILNSRRRSTVFSPDTIRKFIGIGSEYKSIIIAVMLLQQDNVLAKQFIKEKLGISEIAPEISITFKRPNYALNNRALAFNEFKTPVQKRFWGAEGFFEDFLELLWSSERLEADQPRNEGYINPEDDESDHYIMFRSFASMMQRLEGRSPLEIFALFDNLKSVGFLDKIDLNVLVSDEWTNIEQFSDGQFQSVYIYAVTELFKDKNCITLLDEPDSFLHPEWQYDFLKQVTEINNESSDSNHVIMSSHSAVTLISHEQSLVNVFRFNDERLICHPAEKGYAINQLASDFLKYSEDKQIISILHCINLENKPVFFTEGSTDPMILRAAWYKLYEEEIPFIPIYAFNCAYLKRLLEDNRIHNEMEGRPFFGLFDFDVAYNDWKGLKWEMIVNDPFKGCLQKLKGKEGYAFLLPVPNIAEIKAQVIKDPDTNETFLADSKVEIEHLFFDDPTARALFEQVPTMGGGAKWIFPNGEKTQFAKNIVPTVANEHFEVFRPMFKFIKATIAASVAKEPTV